jgi:dCTP deaminase
LIITEEVVHIPLTTIGLISIRATVKFLGLINVSGFHVDPGFTGRLKFSVYNAGNQDIVLERGQRIFMMWLCDLDRLTKDGYVGPRERQMGITASDVQYLRGEIASPAALKQEIKDLEASVDKRVTALEKDVTLYRSVVIALLIALLLTWLKELREPKHGASSPPAPAVSEPVRPVLPPAQRAPAPSSTDIEKPISSPAQQPASKP